MRKFLCAALLIMPLISFSQKLLFLQDKVKGQIDFVNENHLDVYTIINQGQFVTNDLLDEKKLRNEIVRCFPSTSATGYAVLDWEGKAMEALISQKDNKALKLYIEQFVKALKIAKQLRPRVKWAFYALPYRQYWNINEVYSKRNYNLAKIIKTQDFIAPSLYIFYPVESAKKGNSEYIKKNVGLALEMGRRYKKPVYPFIWHRVHPSNKEYGEKLVDIDVFEEAIFQITNVTYNGGKIAGLIWWHAENFSYLNRAKSNVFLKEYAHVSDPNKYQKNMFQLYYNRIKKHL